MYKRKIIRDYLEVGLTRGLYWDDVNFPKNVDTPTYWKCKICGYRHKVRYHDINKVRDCPRCYGNRWKSVKDYLVVGLKRNIIWDDINLPKNTKVKTWWKCLRCDYRWRVRYGVIQQGHGCPRCNIMKQRNQSITDEERIVKRKYQEYKIWRFAVYERDNYTCQICGDNKGNNLNAHHLENYANNIELRTVLENGICLCKRCHKKFHSIYGKTNNTRKQFEKFCIIYKKRV